MDCILEPCLGKGWLIERSREDVSRQVPAGRVGVVGRFCLAECVVATRKDRTVEEARRRIVEAMELFIDDVRSREIVDDVKLPAPATKERFAPSTRATLRKKSRRREDRRAALAARRAVRVLSWRTPEDERARRGTRARSVTSARSPAYAG